VDDVFIQRLGFCELLVIVLGVDLLETPYC
jgi:hypothetical protein